MRRTFERDAPLLLLVKAYEDGRLAPHDLRIVAELRREGHPSIRLATGTRARPGGEESKVETFVLTMPLTNVPPGSYVLHVEAQSSLGATATSRAVPLTVR